MPDSAGQKTGGVVKDTALQSSAGAAASGGGQGGGLDIAKGAELGVGIFAAVAAALGGKKRVVKSRARPAQRNAKTATASSGLSNTTLIFIGVGVLAIVGILVMTTRE